MRQKASSAIRCIRTDGCWFGSSRGSANSSAKTRPAETNRQQLAYRPVVKPGPPLSVVLGALVKPGPPLLRVNRRIVVFFFRRGRSGFHAVPDRGWRGWSGFHAAPDRGRRGWSGFHAKLEGDRRGWSGFHRGSDKGQGRRELGSGCDEETGTCSGRRFSECLACGETHHNGSGGGPRCARRRRARLFPRRSVPRIASVRAETPWMRRMRARPRVSR